jgi:hypothetical protein
LRLIENSKFLVFIGFVDDNHAIEEGILEVI